MSDYLLDELARDAERLDPHLVVWRLPMIRRRGWVDAHDQRGAVEVLRLSLLGHQYVTRELTWATAYRALHTHAVSPGRLRVAAYDTGGAAVIDGELIWHGDRDTAPL